MATSIATPVVLVLVVSTGLMAQARNAKKTPKTWFDHSTVSLGHVEKSIPRIATFRFRNPTDKRQQIRLKLKS